MTAICLSILRNDRPTSRGKHRLYPDGVRLLKVLTKNPQIVLTRQVLLEKLWDIDGNFVDEHALTSTISRVRTKNRNRRPPVHQDSVRHGLHVDWRLEQMKQ